MKAGVFILLLLVLSSCSVKRNNFFSRQYHQLTTRYNVYFNGNEGLKSGLKRMENGHKEDYTNLLPVFVSSDEQTMGIGSSDMDYVIEKAAKAIDKHSITAKPKRRRNKDSKNYETFRKKKEFNNQLVKCYVLLGKGYFYKQKYAMANNTFRFIQRQYPDDEKVQTEVALWLFRSLTEMERFDEAVKFQSQLNGAKLNKKQREMYAAAMTDFNIRQEQYAQAASECERLTDICKSMKRRPRYYFLLSQLYLKDGQSGMAMNALKKVSRFNFNYEMVFNAKINMALAYQAGDEGIKKKLSRMLRDSKNDEYRDRIYFALANIEEKKGNEEGAIDLYWKSVHSSVNNDNQQSMSYFKLGDYYFKERDYVVAQSCYDSCIILMDSRNQDYDRLKGLATDLTELVVNLRTIQRQDSLLKLAALPEGERNSIIDDIIQDIKDKEQEAKEAEQKAQAERNFYDRNNMLSRGDAFSQSGSSGGDWYFYNPMTVSLGKNDFKRKWGRRKLEDNWRRQNKAMVEIVDQPEEELAEGDTEGKKEITDVKSREYYTKDLPLTPEQVEVSKGQVENAYYKAGEIYMYKFNDHEKALDCFKSFIGRFPGSNNLPMVYYLAYAAADKVGKTVEAGEYKNALISKFPESDYARGLLDPQYFKKVDGELHSVDRMYQEAFALYQKVYYAEALAACEDIMSRYPDNKMKANVLFLKAMCVVNMRSPQEAREALNEVLAAKPDKEIATVVNSVLASLAVGDKPVLYSDAEMATARDLRENRHWVFDKDGGVEREKEEAKSFTFDKGKEHMVIIVLPEDFSLIQMGRFQARITFINAAEAVEGKSYSVEKENLGYKKPILVVKGFTDGEEAMTYLNRVGADRLLLKNIDNGDYRMFTITPDNYSVLKRMKNVEEYVNFFTENYFEDHNKGNILAGRQGTAAHVFSYEESARHHFVLALPFRKVNTKRVAESLKAIESAFILGKEDYDDETEMIVVKNVGDKALALEYMNTVMGNKDIFDKMAGVDYQSFVITPENLKTLLNDGYLEEYLKFFKDNYLRTVETAGVEDGDFTYNKNLSHKFILLYSNSIDPFKLKAVFEEFNFAGLNMNNMKYDEEHDCMVVSGFGSKDEAMRYFNTVISSRKLFKPLKNTEYTNFIITEPNMDVMMKQHSAEKYLDFFKKYYIN